MSRAIVLDYRPGALAELERTVLEAIEYGAQQVVLNLDTLRVLDNDGIRDLIRLLRRSREVGGTLALQTTQPAVLRTLSVTALDRVFDMALPSRST